MATCEVLIAGDFNSKSPEWGESRSDRRGAVISEFVARNDLVILNRGNESTFQRGEAASIIDITIGSAGIARKVNDWVVLEEETLSDHRYIWFTIALNEGSVCGTTRKNKDRPSWNTKKLNVDKARESLVESRLIRDLGWSKSTESLEEIFRETKRIVVDACNASMPKRNAPKCKRQVYWWTSEIAELRKNCIKARRLATRAKSLFSENTINALASCSRKRLKEVKPEAGEYS